MIEIIDTKYTFQQLKKANGEESIQPDGSLRGFKRYFVDDKTSVVLIVPPDNDEASFREAQSVYNIGRHLYSQQVPVPKIYDFDRQSGQLLMEDLGDIRLYDLLQGADEAFILNWYRKVIKVLLAMQFQGRRGFSLDWCYDSMVYDENIMISQESDYFLNSLCRDYCGFDWSRDGVARECCHIARQAARAVNGFFLHRDFQSRNLMIKDNKIKIIDFQGGRFGPLAYDLASLLRDPYMSLPADMQQELLDFYFSELQGYMHYDKEQFVRDYFFLSLQRNLQILGAFAFLSQKRKKDFFARFILPSLESLQELLRLPAGEKYPLLNQLTVNCCEWIKNNERK